MPLHSRPEGHAVQVARAFFQACTKASDDSEDILPQEDWLENKLSVFHLFSELFPDLTSAAGKKGLMRLQFNKVGYELYDKEQSRRVPAVRAKPGNPGYGFRRARWRDYSDPQDAALADQILSGIGLSQPRIERIKKRVHDFRVTWDAVRRPSRPCGPGRPQKRGLKQEAVQGEAGAKEWHGGEHEGGERQRYCVGLERSVDTGAATRVHQQTHQYLNMQKQEEVRQHQRMQHRQQMQHHQHQMQRHQQQMHRHQQHFQELANCEWHPAAPPSGSMEMPTPGGWRGSHVVGPAMGAAPGGGPEGYVLAHQMMMRGDWAGSPDGVAASSSGMHEGHAYYFNEQQGWGVREGASMIEMQGREMGGGDRGSAVNYYRGVQEADKPLGANAESTEPSRKHWKQSQEQERGWEHAPGIRTSLEQLLAENQSLRQVNVQQIAARGAMHRSIHRLETEAIMLEKEGLQLLEREAQRHSMSQGGLEESLRSALGRVLRLVSGRRNADGNAERDIQVWRELERAFAEHAEWRKLQPLQPRPWQQVSHEQGALEDAGVDGQEEEEDEDDILLLESFPPPGGTGGICDTSWAVAGASLDGPLGCPVVARSPGGVDGNEQPQRLVQSPSQHQWLRGEL